MNPTFEAACAHLELTGWAAYEDKVSWNFVGETTWFIRKTDHEKLLVGRDLFFATRRPISSVAAVIGPARPILWAVIPAPMFWALFAKVTK